MVKDKGVFSGNKGEWSEPYVFLKLLADGRLFAADGNLEPIADIYYPILSILRDEVASSREYRLNDDVKIIDPKTNDVLLVIPLTAFSEYSKRLFDRLTQKNEVEKKEVEKEGEEKEQKGLMFPEIEEFLRQIHINSLSASKRDKSDIHVKVHDLFTGQTPTLGFSIKSLLGGDSTLVNSTPGTNFIFLISNPKSIPFDVDAFNRETYSRSGSGKGKGKISIRLQQLLDLGLGVSFDKIQSDRFNLNLLLIDSQLPAILSHLLFIKFFSGESSVSKLLVKIIEINPLGFDLTQGHPFYEHKVKNF